MMRVWTDLGYRELFVRWFQYGAFLPMFRAHGTDTPREIWRFGEPGEPFYDALVSALRLRYRLLPYIYSLAGWTTQHDYTMLRALPFDFRSDPVTYNIATSICSARRCWSTRSPGPCCTTRDRSRWRVSRKPARSTCPPAQIGMISGPGKRILAAKRFRLTLPSDRLPLYVRAGSILPMGPDPPACE